MSFKRDTLYKTENRYPKPTQCSGSEDHLNILWNQFLLKDVDFSSSESINVKVSLMGSAKNKELYSQDLILEPTEISKKHPDQALFLKKCQWITDHNFEKYSECGTKIDLSLAIDFTISNGNHRKGERSLH